MNTKWHFRPSERATLIPCNMPPGKLFPYSMAQWRKHLLTSLRNQTEFYPSNLQTHCPLTTTGRLMPIHTRRKIQDKQKPFNLVSCFFLKDQEKTEKKFISSIPRWFNGSQKNPHRFWAIWVPIQLLRIIVSRNQKLYLPKNYRGRKGYWERLSGTLCLYGSCFESTPPS